MPGGLWAAGRGEERSIERIHGTAEYGRRVCSLLTGPLDVWCWKREKSGSPGPLLLVVGWVRAEQCGVVLWGWSVLVGALREQSCKGQ